MTIANLSDVGSGSSLFEFIFRAISAAAACMASSKRVYRRDILIGDGLVVASPRTSEVGHANVGFLRNSLIAAAATFDVANFAKAILCSMSFDGIVIFSIGMLLRATYLRIASTFSGIFSHAGDPVGGKFAKTSEFDRSSAKVFPICCTQHTCPSLHTPESIFRGLVGTERRYSSSIN